MNTIKNRLKDNTGLMGKTHALSALAFSLVLVAFFPKFMFGTVLKTTNLLVLIAAMFIISGYALWPDFDNSKSTAISTFGFIGEMISSLMRWFAVLIYSITRSKHDDPNPNPHRGFWHTLISSIFLGVILTTTSSITKIVKLPIINKNVSIGFLFAVLWLYIGIKLAIAGLLGDLLKKIKNKGFIYILGFELFGIIFSVSVLLFAPGTLRYTWIGFAASLGYAIHLLGDCLTVAGAPILWPFKHKGKRWWNYRFLGFKAGGTVEQLIITPIFILVILLCIGRLIYLNFI